MGYTHFDQVSGIRGVGIGAKGSETLVIDSTGNVVSGAQSAIQASFGTASTAQTVYSIVPYAGTVTAVYVCNDTASRAAVYTVTHGSAGNVLATGTNTTGVAGLVSTLTLGTVTVTAGESLSVARGTQGSTGGGYVTIVIKRTS